VAEHLTEEEQVEAFKRWWSENWASVVFPIIIALGGYVAWNAWGSHQQGQAESASSQYQDLIDLVEVTPGEELSDEKKLNAKELATSIVEDFPSGMYGNLSSLMLARFAVEENELDKAVELISGVVEKGANEPIAELAKTRLARVLSAKGKHEEALSLVASTNDGAYKSLKAEIRGDIYLAQGETSLARTAYQEALDNLSMEQFSRRGLVQVKFDSTAAPSSSAISAPEVKDSSEAEPSEAQGDA